MSDEKNDVEGHGFKMGAAPKPEKPETEQDDDDDTEGHGFRMGIAPGPQDPK